MAEVTVADQIKLAEELKKATEESAAAMIKFEQSLKSQITTMEQLVSSMSKMRDNLDEVKKNDPFSELTKGADSLKSKTEEVNDSLKKNDELFSAGQKSGLYFTAVLTGLVDGFSNIVAIGGGVLGFLGKVADGFFNVGAAILAIPFKMFERLISTASNFSGDNSLQAAIEAVRKEFGAFRETVARTVLDTSKHLKGFEKTGLSVWRVFGNMAQRIEAVHKVATGMGATFNIVSKEFNEAGGALLAYQKGLGLSEEDMGSVAARAITMGESLETNLNAITKQTQALGDMAGSTKLMARDMAKAMKDVKNFGQLTVKEIGAAAAYARKLGVELEKITGTLSAFDTFEGAAENASKLSQTFGVTVDAFEMLNAQSPAEIVDSLKKSFSAAGVDASKFNRAQLDILASTSGLDAATAKQVFSLKNLGGSMEDIKKKSDKAEKKQMSQAEAMNKLADAIERLTFSGTNGVTGFWDAFLKGITGGIQSTPEFMKIIMNIKNGLWQVQMVGVELGRAIVKYFPGLHDFFDSIGKMFEPGRITKLFSGFKDVFVDFMKELSSGQGRASFPALMEKLKSLFFNFFSDKTAEGQQFLSSLKLMMKTIVGLIGEGIKWAADAVADGIKSIVDMMYDDTIIDKAAEGAGGAMAFLAPLVDAFKHAWDVLAPVIWKAVKEIATTIGSNLYDFMSAEPVIGYVKKAGMFLAAVMFGPAVMNVLLTTLVSGIGSIMGSGIKSAMGAASKMTGATGSTASVAKDLSKAADTKINWGNVMKFLLGVAAAIAIGIAEVWVAVQIFKDVSPTQLLKAIAVIGTIALAMVPVAGSIALLQYLKIDPSTTLIGILAIGTALTALVGLFGGLYALFQYFKVDYTQMALFSGIVVALTGAFLVAAAAVGAAMVVGIVVGNPLTAVAAVVGFTAISSFISRMITLTVDLMKELLKMPYESQLKDKIEIFIKSFSATMSFFEIVSKQQVDLANASKGMSDSSRSKLFGQLGANITLMTDSLKGVIDKIIESVERLAGNTSKEVIQAASSFASLLSAVTEIGKILRPPMETIERETADNYASISTSSTKETRTQIAQGASAAALFLSSTELSLQNVITSVQSFATTMGLMKFDKDQLKSIEVSAKIIPAVVDVIKSLQLPPSAFTILARGGSEAGAEGAKQIRQAIEKQGEGVKGIMQTLGNIMPDIIKGFKGFKADDFKGTEIIMPILKSVFWMVGEVMKAGSAMAGKTGDKAGTNLAILLDAPKTLLKGMVDVLFGTGGIVSYLQAINGADVDIKNSKSVIKSIYDVNDISEATLKALDTVTKFPAEMKEGAFKPATKAITGMVDAMQEIHGKIKTLTTNKISLSATLGQLAGAVGMGANAKYFVNAGGVAINVQMTVYMKADEVERVMIMREDSIIRNRMNYALENPSQKGVPEIPAKYQPTLNKVTSG